MDGEAKDEITINYWTCPCINSKRGKKQTEPKKNENKEEEEVYRWMSRKKKKGK